MAYGNMLGMPLAMTQLAGQMQPQAQPQMQPQQPQRGGIFDIIGQVSDIISTSRGAPETYGIAEQRKQGLQQQQEMKNALAQWMQNPEDQAAFMRMMQVDPERALKLRQGMMGNQGEAFTLGEGQARYGPDGKVIAQGPEGAPDTVTIDGVVFDKSTGEPLFESPYNRIIPGPEGSFYEQPRAGFGRRSPEPTIQNTPPPRLGENGLPNMLTPEQYKAVVNAKGQEATDAWAKKHNMAIGKTVNGQQYYLVNGKWYDNPEGR